MGRMKDILAQKEERDQEFAEMEMEYLHIPPTKNRIYKKIDQQNNDLEKGTKMKKVAFDVQGTLLGRHSAKVIALFKWFESKGCKMAIWSFGGAYMARDAAKKCRLTASCYGKIVLDRDEFEPSVDICVDDDLDARDILSAGNVILVHEIPEDSSQFEALFGNLLE